MTYVLRTTSVMRNKPYLHRPVLLRDPSAHVSGHILEGDIVVTDFISFSSVRISSGKITLHLIAKVNKNNSRLETSPLII